MPNKTLTNNPSGENTLEVPVVNFSFNKQQPKQPNKEWITITGIATSQVRNKSTSDTPAYIFLRANNNKHSLKECVEKKCKSCEIPVIFRIKKEFWDNGSLTDIQNNSFTPQKRSEYIKPRIKKGNNLQLGGYFADTHKPRPSFTAYSYQVL